jgi:hypothetical protein
MVHLMTPPFLVIRHGKAFWVETRPPQDATATLQAFADGCYSGTSWYDSTGGAWTVVEARLKERPSLLDRALQRPVAVELCFGPRTEGDVAEVLTRIGEVLRSDNEFCDALKTPAAQIWAQFERAHTTADLIALASRLE